MQLAVKPGEILGLIGENGAGKSTLIKVLTGVHKPDEGEIYVEGKQMTFHNPNESAAAGIACVYQELNIEKLLSITDNIFINKWKKGPMGLLDYASMHKKAKEVGTLIGLINGTLLTRLHLPHPFVSTLGMKNFLWGASLLVTGSQMISNFPSGVMALGSATIGGFPISFIVVVIIYILMHILLTRTALGRSIYCAGGNMEATRLSGIDVANVLTFCYALSGFMAAVAGMVSIGRSGICNGANAIQPYDTDAIASCVIGGASFMGGKGTMFGTIIGALVIATLRNGFILLSVNSAVQNMVLGLVIIGAILLDVTREAMAAKARRKEAGAKA